jgi:NAD(P)H-hydrate epimerase
MLSIAVPASLKALLLNHLPDALIIDCPETEEGAIANLSPLAADFSQYDTIACGPGLTLDTLNIVQNVLTAPCPLLLDADALNLLAQLLAQGGTVTTLGSRPAPTVLTPHLGEFKRLFPEILADDRLAAVKAAAQVSQAVVLLKGAKTAIANPQGSLRLIADSTPALARGGSGDVLTGLIGGLMAQLGQSPNDLPENLLETVATAAYWHAQAGILAAADRTDLGVDAHTLTTYLNPALVHCFS